MSSLLHVPLRRSTATIGALRRLAVVASHQRHGPQQTAAVVHILRRSMGHTVRIIATQDLPNGKCAEGEVVHVKAGYARNYLIPQKMAVYATQKNFARLGLTDPVVDIRLASLLGEDVDVDAGAAATTSVIISSSKAVEKGSDEEKDLKAAELLKHYLRNKVLKIWRNVDTSSAGGGDSNRLHPGMVDARAVRKKLSKQLLIDLEPHEQIHLRAQPLAATGSSTTTTSTADVEGQDEDDDDTADTRVFLSEEDELNALVQEIPRDAPCNVQIRQLGDYLASISLRGDHVVPLKVAVLKR